MTAFEIARWGRSSEKSCPHWQ